MSVVCVGGAKSMRGIVAELRDWVRGRVGKVLGVDVGWTKWAEAKEVGRAESEVEVYRRRELHLTRYGDASSTSIQQKRRQRVGCDSISSQGGRRRREEQHQEVVVT